MDITIGNPNPITGRWNFVRGADGDVSFDDTEAHAVVTSSLEHKGEYWADRNHGSDLHQLRSLTRRTPSQAEAMEHQALAPLEQAGAIEPATVAASINRSTGRLDLDVRWTTPGGSRGAQTVSV